jgi:molybdate transport system ATP-binding protein
VGRRLRVRVLARDVSIAREKILATSILNTLKARVVALADDAHPAQALVQLAVGDALLVARLTRRSVAALELQPGQAVWAQIKTAALIG